MRSNAKCLRPSWTSTADLECDAFKTGVRFGARMMMEILDVDDGQNL